MEMQLAVHVVFCLTGIVSDSLTSRDHVYTSTRHAAIDLGQTGLVADG